MHVCGEGIRKAGAHLELEMRRATRTSTGVLAAKKKTGKNVGSLLNGVENLVMKDAEQAEVLSVFFALVFTEKTCLQAPQARETRGKVWSKETLPLEKEGQTMKYLDKPDMQVYGT